MRRTISATGLAVIRRCSPARPSSTPTSGLSQREWRELMAVLGRDPLIDRDRRVVHECEGRVVTSVGVGGGYGYVTKPLGIGLPKETTQT